MIKGPLAGRYPAVAAMVLLSLIPFLALSASLEPLAPIICRDLHMSAQTFSLSSGLGNAGYALGTVLAVQFAQHLPQRRMLLVYGLALVVGSVLAASAANAGMYITGHILQGTATSMLLIAAAPPLAIGFPPSKLRTTAVIMNMCIFGAVALGPFIGGAQAGEHGWRPLFWIVAAVSLLAFVLALLTFDDAPPLNPDSPRDVPAIALAAVGCVAAFTGAAELTSHRFLSGIVLGPLVGGLIVILVLVVYQFRAANPLLTIRSLLTSSIPVANLVVALFAAAASVSVTALSAAALGEKYSPVHVGLLFIPELGGAVISAIAFGAVIRRREIHFLPFAGMLALAIGIVLFRVEVPASQPLALIGSAVVGIGLGGTVAPALFVAGFSLPAMSLQRVFAIVELLRAVAAFMIAPIFAHFALGASGGLAAGTATALWVGLGLAVGGAVLGIAVYVLSGARAQRPDIDGFVEGPDAAWTSPPLLARLRRDRRSEPVLEPVA